MITKEQKLKNDLKDEIKKHNDLVEFHKKQIERNERAMDHHTGQVKEAQDILYKLEGFK